MSSGLDLYSCYFESNSFYDSLFTGFGVFYPDSLNRAVFKRKAEYLAGRICASRLLHLYGQADYYLKSDNSGCPMWPEPIVGSIGHTGNIAVAAVSIDPEIVGVGVDVEMIFNESENTDVKSQVILENEITLVEKPGDVENLLLTLIFSIKESFFKAAYPIVQKYFGFEFLEVTNIDLTAGRFQVSLTQDLGIHFQQGQTFSGRFEEEPDHVVTVVAINRGNLAA